MKLKELCDGKIGLLTQQGTLYGRCAARLGSVLYILAYPYFKEIPETSVLTELIVLPVGDYNNEITYTS